MVSDASAWDGLTPFQKAQLRGVALQVLGPRAASYVLHVSVTHAVEIVARWLLEPAGTPLAVRITVEPTGDSGGGGSDTGPSSGGLDVSADRFAGSALERAQVRKMAFDLVCGNGPGGFHLRSDPSVTKAVALVEAWLVARETRDFPAFTVFERDVFDGKFEPGVTDPNWPMHRPDKNGELGSWIGREVVVTTGPYPASVAPVVRAPLVEDGGAS